MRTADDRGGARQEEEATAQNAAAALAGRRAVRHGHPNSEYEEEEDTLKGLNEVQLSTVVAEVLNYSRDSTSSVGFKRTATVDKIEKRNIVV